MAVCLVEASRLSPCLLHSVLSTGLFWSPKQQRECLGASWGFQVSGGGDEIGQRHRDTYTSTDVCLREAATFAGAPHPRPS